MRSQGVLTAKASASVTINQFIKSRNNTCDGIQETNNLIHCSYYWQLRTLVNLNQCYLGTRDLV
jgi:hypothetical protein